VDLLDSVFPVSNALIFRCVEDIRLKAKSTVKLEASDQAALIEDRACKKE